MLRLLFFCIGLISVSFRLDAQWSQVGDVITCRSLSDAPQLATGPDGTLHLTYGTNDTLCLQHFNGAQWSVDSRLPEFKPVFSAFALSRSGIPFIAKDSFSHLVVMMFQGSQWIHAGDARRVIKYPGSFIEPVLAFDSSDMPCATIYARSVIVRYDGSSWDTISRKDDSFLYGIYYKGLYSDGSGYMYATTNELKLYQHHGDTSWQEVNLAGITITPTQYAFMKPRHNSAGDLYLVHGDYGAFISVYKRTGNFWSKIGADLPKGRGLCGSLLFGRNDLPYLAMYQKNGRAFDLIRFNGSEWVDVDTVGLPDNELLSIPISDRGYIYVVIRDAPNSLDLRVMKYDTRADPVSVSATRALSGVTLAPNPAENYVTVRCSNMSFLGKSATVTDNQGRALHQFRLAADSRIETASWPSGTYYIQLPDGAAVEVVKR